MKLDPVRFADTFVNLARQRLGDGPAPDQALPEDLFEPAAGGRLCLQAARPADFEQPERRAALLWSAAMASWNAGTSAGSLPALLAAETALQMVSREEEARLGADEHRATLSETPLCTDPALLAQAEAAFARVAPVAGRDDLHFHVLEDDRPQAFNMFNHIYLTSGELRGHRDPDHTLGTVGHEVGHGESRDTVKRLGLDALEAALTEGYQVLMSRGAFDSRSFGNYMQRHNGPDRLRRQAELEADRRSMGILHALGANPASTLEFFRDKPAGPIHPEGKLRVAAMEDELTRLREPSESDRPAPRP